MTGEQGRNDKAEGRSDRDGIVGDHGQGHTRRVGVTGTGS